MSEAQWSRIEKVFGKHLRGDVSQVITQCTPGYSRGKYDMAARTFFTWLGSASWNPWFAVRDLYRDASTLADSEATGEFVIQTAVNTCFRHFCDELPVYASIERSSVWERQRCAALVLAGLGSISTSRYPSFLVALHKRHRALTETPMLGSLPIASEIVEPPGMRRERMATDRVGLLALEEFRDHASMIEAGIEIRADIRHHSNSFPERDCVRSVLAKAWAELPNRRAGVWRNTSDLISGASDLAELPNTWVAAGIPERCIRRFVPDGRKMSRSAVGHLALACLGPSPTMVISGMAVVACGRGWNKSPMLELAADPFVFAVGSQYGLASGSFIAAMKERAKHAVAMFLSDPQSRAAGSLENVIEEWREVAASPGSNKLGDQMLLGLEMDDAWGAAVLEVIQGLIRLSKPLRRYDGLYASIDRLFAYPPLNDRYPTHWKNSLVLKSSTTPALARGGISFPAIRASWVYLEYLRRRSLPATTAAAGQVTLSVTTTSYLNRREVGDELRRALRFFQSICQSLVVDDEVMAVRIGLADADFARLRGLAIASGMGAAFGLGLPQGGRSIPVINFTPSDANMRDLFLSLWATRVANRLLPRPIWQARCFELYVVARAIAAELRSSGLAAKYAAAAQVAYADVRAGRVSLPCVEGA